MKEPTCLERLAGNVMTQGGLVAVSAAVGTPLAALLPVLANTLAAGRHNARVEAELARISVSLGAHQEQLDAMTDPQYKFLNELILTVMQNTEDEKVGYLHRAMIAGLGESDIGHTLAAQVSRALRDLTAGELAFVLKHFGGSIQIGPFVVPSPPDVTVIDRTSDDMVYVSGLIGLGVLVPAGSGMDDGGTYVFSGFVQKLKECVEFGIDDTASKVLGTV